MQTNSSPLQPSPTSAGEDFAFPLPLQEGSRGVVTLNIDLGNRSYPIYIGRNLLNDKEMLRRHLATNQVMLVSNTTVAPLYLQLVRQTLTSLNVQEIILPDGVFLSNGPGDPAPCDYAIRAIGEILLTGLPVFGICLGHQLLGLASGARTVKMKFGHHGANHPVQDLERGCVFITSQNHGFAIDEASLPPQVQATHRSLFDGSLQGIKRTDCPAFSFQGHPEASPGPHDIGPLFDQFIELMATHSMT